MARSSGATRSTPATCMASTSTAPL
jgi:hypothetical protein